MTVHLLQVSWYIFCIYSVIQLQSHFSTRLRCTHTSSGPCTQARIPFKNACHSSKTSFISGCIFIWHLLLWRSISFIVCFPSELSSREELHDEEQSFTIINNELPKLPDFGVHILPLAGLSFWQKLIKSFALINGICDYACLARKKTSLLWISNAEASVCCRHLNQGSCDVIAIAKQKGTFQLNIPEVVRAESLLLFASLIIKGKYLLVFNHSHSVSHIELLSICNSLVRAPARCSGDC